MNNLSKIIVPRDVQNVSSLINSKNSLNKFSWEKDGEEVNLILYWLFQIINNHNYCLCPNNKRILKTLLLKKMPDSMRAKVKYSTYNKINQIWLLTSGAKREIMNNPDYYGNLTDRFPKSIPSPFVEQIEMVSIYQLFTCLGRQKNFPR